jgi:hypothetical protein
MFTMAVSDGYLDSRPFHDAKTPKVPGPRPIRITITGQYLRVRSCLPTKPARVFWTPPISGSLLRDHRDTSRMSTRPVGVHCRGEPERTLPWHIAERLIGDMHSPGPLEIRAFLPVAWST